MFKMEASSDNEADPEFSHSTIESVYIKEEPPEDMGNTEPVVNTIKKEAVSNDEADPTVTHSTEPAGLVLKIKERWQYCQNVWKQQSNMNEPVDIEAESNETVSLQLRCHKVPAEDHIQDVKPVTWHKVQHTTNSPDSETSMSSEDVPVPDHDIMESVYIKEEDIDSRSSDEDIQDSDSSDNERLNKSPAICKTSHRVAEIIQQRMELLAKSPKHRALIRSQKKALQLAKDRERRAKHRENETLAERLERQAKDRVRNARYEANLTEAKKLERLARARERRARETEEKRKQRLAKRRGSHRVGEYKSETYSEVNETMEKRIQCLAND